MPQVPFFWAVIASATVDGIVALAALRSPQLGRKGEDPSTIGTARVARAVLITGIVFLGKLVVLGRLGLQRFGVIHLLYADLVVLLPTLGLVLLLAPRLSPRLMLGRSPTKAVRLAALASLLLVPIGLDATFIEPFRLQLEEAQVPVRPERRGRRPIRIGVLSDLQTNSITAHERSAVDRLMALKPDLILLPGDIFQGWDAEFEASRSALTDLLARLSAPGGVYFVLGDVDGDGRELRPILAQTSIRTLVNEVVQVTIGDRLVTIGGSELDFSSPGSQGVAEHLESLPGDEDIRILVAHRPDVVLGLKRRSRIDLTVAGHTHGGQIVIPGFGPPMTLTRVPRAVAAGGLHAIQENPIYVSRGVGYERRQAPRIRFWCPPEISLLEVGGRPATPPEASRSTSSH